jgi:hypothetical protein
VYRLYQLRASPPEKLFSWFYFVMSFLFAVLGGTVAVILPATNLYAAFYAGATAPITVSAMTRQKHGEKDFANAKPLAPDSQDHRSLVQIIRDHAGGLFP